MRPLPIPDIGPLPPWEQPSRGRPRGTTTGTSLDLDRLRDKTAYIPASIDPQTFSRQVRDYACWILNLIGRYQRRHQLSAEAWVPLPQAYLETMMSYSSYRHVIGDLISRDFIERKDSPGDHTCYCYRFTAPYRADRLVPYPITKRVLLKRLYACQLATADGLRLPVHRTLFRWLQTVTISDDAPDKPELNEIREGNLWTKVCDYGRVHTPITSLPGEFRPYLRLDGYADLVSVDVSHCQLVLLAQWLRRNGWATDSAFEEQALGARIYSTFAEALKVDRETAKTRFLNVLYGYPQRGKFDPNHAAVFSALYPRTWESCATYTLAKPPVNLACRMQRLESEVMIDTAAAMFIERHPDAPILTIHDALIVTREDANRAAACINAAFERLYNVWPNVKIDREWASASTAEARKERRDRKCRHPRRRHCGQKPSHSAGPSSYQEADDHSAG